MGCDIHIYVERKHKGKWVMSHEGPKPAKERNYARFANLAGVRGDGPAPKGLPIDVSESVDMHADLWGSDGHSHSWLTLDEAIPIFLKRHYKGDELTDFEKDYPGCHFFGVETDEKSEEFRVVFWFDN